MGADMIELDVQLTSDKEVIVFHDEKISRCTDSHGRIADHTLDSLKKMDAGSWFNKNFTNTRIPTLAEVLDICKNKIAVNIEIKTEAVSKMFFGGIDCPVLSVGPNVVHQQKSVAEFNRILLATNFGAESLAAASYAVSLAQEHQARLSLLHVLAPPHAEPRATATDLESNPDPLMRGLQELVPPDTELWCHPEYFIQFGPPADRILQFSGAHGVDLIVMGVHPAYGAVSAVTHLVHSTAQHIVAHATCPVLTVRG